MLQEKGMKRKWEKKGRQQYIDRTDLSTGGGSTRKKQSGRQN